MKRIEKIKRILESLYWQGRENAEYAINAISVQPELEQIDQLYKEPQEDEVAEAQNLMGEM